MVSSNAIRLHDPSDVGDRFGGPAGPHDPTPGAPALPVPVIARCTTTVIRPGYAVHAVRVVIDTSDGEADVVDGMVTPLTLCGDLAEAKEVCGLLPANRVRELFPEATHVVVNDGKGQECHRLALAAA